MRKKVKLIAVPFRPDKLEAGMYWMNEKKLYQLDENDLHNSAIQDELFFDRDTPATLVQFYLISDEDEIQESDLVYDSKEFPKEKEKHLQRQNITRCITKEVYQYVALDGFLHDYKTSHKIIATPEQIGVIYYETSAMDKDGNTVFPYPIGIDELQFIINRGSKCEVEVEEINDRVVMGGLRFDGDDGLGPRSISITVLRTKLLNDKVIIYIED